MIWRLSHYPDEAFPLQLGRDLWARRREALVRIQAGELAG